MKAVLDHFRLSGAPLGEGAEAQVWALEEARVLRIPKDPAHSGLSARTALLTRLAPGAWAAGVPIPQVLEQGETGGVPWVIEARLPGTDLAAALKATPDRPALIRAYLKMADTVGDVLSGADYRELAMDPPVVAATGPAFLTALAARSLDWAGLRIAPPDPGALDGPPALVHLDYFPGNVMSDGHRITGVIDWGFGTVLADRRLNPLVAALSLRFRTDVTEAELAVAEDWLAERGLNRHLPAVRRWLAAFWSFAIPDDPELAAWARPALGIGRP